MNENKTNINNIVTMLNERLAPMVTCQAITTEKNNGIIRNGIRFDQLDVNISPVVYIDDIINDTNLEETVEIIIDTYKTNVSMNFDVDDISKKIKNKGWIYANAKPRLSKAPASGLIKKRFLDIWVTYYIEVSAGAIIQLREDMNLNVENLHKNALCNMNITVENMNDLLSEMGYPLPDSTIPMYVISVESKLFGAAAILDKYKLAKLADEVNSSLYIIPSSIHECIAVPTYLGNSTEDITEMIKCVNGDPSIMKAEDILSDSVYIYIKDQVHLQIA